MEIKEVQRTMNPQRCFYRKNGIDIKRDFLRPNIPLLETTAYTVSTFHIHASYSMILSHDIYFPV